MRITDDVAHGISTFYAEILRIKKMAEEKKTGEPMICFIDEIFKGKWIQFTGADYWCERVFIGKKGI